MNKLQKNRDLILELLDDLKNQKKDNENQTNISDVKFDDSIELKSIFGTVEKIYLKMQT